MLPRVGKLTEGRGFKLLVAVHRRGGADGAGTLGAALTYQTFLSLFPLVLLGLSAVGFLLAGNTAQQADWTRRFTGAIPGLASLVGRNLKAAVDGRFGTGALGLIGVAWTGGALSSAAAGALGRIFRTPPASGTADAVRRRARALATMAGLGLLGLASTVLTGLATGWSGNPALRLLGIALGVAVDLGFFLVAYRSLTPPGGPAFRDHLPGAVAMTAGWTGLKVAGSWYAVRVVARARALYGTVGAVFGLLAVLSLAVRLFLYGAELSAVLLERRRAANAP